MTNEKVIARLKQKNWSVTCQNEQEASLVLQACDGAGITWAGGEKATEWFPFKTYPFDIGFFKEENGITQDYYNLYEKYELENITDLFFNAVNTPTPLPTSREMWGFIDKKWRLMAMDRSKIIYLYEEKPTARDGLWLPEDGSYSQCPLNINTEGINWETSLTERPKDV